MGPWDDRIDTNPGILQSIWSTLYSGIASLRTPTGRNKERGLMGPHPGSEAAWRHCQTQLVPD